MTSVWTPIRHTHLADQVYAEVRDRILSRAIQIDKLVNVEEISSELGVSRTPVLDAIKRLASEGLVEIKPRRGTYVKGISEQDLIEIFQMREVLELYAAKHIIAQEDNAAVIAQMQQALDEMRSEVATAQTDYKAYTAADKAFHTTLIGACQNQRMITAYDNLNIHLHIMRGHLHKSLVPPKVVDAEHSAMLLALKERDYPAAENTIKTHLQSAMKKMLDNIRDNGGYL